MKTNIVRFKIWNCIPKLVQYGNGCPAITLIDAEDFSPVATATVNLVRGQMYDDRQLPSDELPPNECYVKTWSENEGMLEALVEAGIVEYVSEIEINQFGSTAARVKILN